MTSVNLYLNPALEFNKAVQKSDDYLKQEMLASIKEADQMSEVEREMLALSLKISKNEKVLDLSNNQLFKKAFAYLEEKGFLENGKRVFKDREIVHLDGAINSVLKTIPSHKNYIWQSILNNRQDQKQLIEMAKQATQMQSDLIKAFNSIPSRGK
jgi:hypothetical protein